MKGLIDRLRSFQKPLSEGFPGQPTWKFVNDEDFKKALDAVTNSFGRVSYRMTIRSIFGSSFNDTKEMDGIDAALGKAGFKKRSASNTWVLKRKKKK